MSNHLKLPLNTSSNIKSYSIIFILYRYFNTKIKNILITLLIDAGTKTDFKTRLKIISKCC